MTESRAAVRAKFSSSHAYGTREYNAEWQRYYRSTETGRRYVRAMNLRKKGLSPEEYDDLASVQGGVCASCGQPEVGRNQYGVVSLAVDHDHGCCSGEKACENCRRGLLCMRCNRALGMLGDSAEIIEKLLNYRRRYA